MGTGKEGNLPLHEASEGRSRLADQSFCILEWTIDASTGRIRCDDSEIKLEPKVMDVLLYLAERAGEVVTRAELEDSVWDQRVVSYETLTSTIQKLRKAFKDDAHDSRVIETLAKRGYRLIAPVSWPDETARTVQSHDEAHKRPKILGVLFVLVAAIGLAGYGYFESIGFLDSPTKMTLPQPHSIKASIAVLPFENLSADKNQEYFSVGLTADLITDLSKISGLSVISRTSTSKYKGMKVDIREIGKALGARYVIEGSVRKTGGRIRISVQLTDADTGRHLWAERYDGQLQDIFSLEDQVLAKVVGSLALRLSEKERARLAKKDTESVAAHDLYLQGLFLESRFSRAGYLEAMRLYERALSIDPSYSLPYAQIANILQLNARNGWSDNVQADLRKAVALAEKSVSLDPQNPYLHWSLGRSIARLKTPGSLPRGIKALEQAIKLDPNYADAHAFLTTLYNGDSRAEEGLKSIATAMRLNPKYPFWYLFMRGMSRYALYDYRSAIADFEAAAERSPTAMFVRWWLAATYAQAGQQEDAEWQVDEMRTLGFTGSIATILETQQPIQDQDYLSRFKKGLRQAGIAEK